MFAKVLSAIALVVSIVALAFNLLVMTGVAHGAPDLQPRAYVPIVVDTSKEGWHCYPLGPGAGYCRNEVPYITW